MIVIALLACVLLSTQATAQLPFSGQRVPGTHAIEVPAPMVAMFQQAQTSKRMFLQAKLVYLQNMTEFLSMVHHSGTGPTNWGDAEKQRALSQVLRGGLPGFGGDGGGGLDDVRFGGEGGGGLDDVRFGGDTGGGLNDARFGGDTGGGLDDARFGGTTGGGLEDARFGGSSGGGLDDARFGGDAGGGLEDFKMTSRGMPGFQPSLLIPMLSQQIQTLEQQIQSMPQVQPKQ